MAPLKPTGFWSYTSIDDSASGGRLSQLRKLLADELQPHVGRARVHIFQDVAAIPPGTDWEREIDDALEQASFFIPILTPGFMQSEWCAKEVNKFRAIMERRGRNDLIVPVHYLDVDGFDTMRRGECYDAEVYRFLRTLQWTDFRPVRLLEPATLEVRQKLETVATGILAALYRAMPGEPVSLAETGPAPATVDAIELLPAAAAETPPPPPPAAIVETPRPLPPVAPPTPPPSTSSRRPNVRYRQLVFAGLIVSVAVGAYFATRPSPSPSQIPIVQASPPQSSTPPPNPAPAKTLRDCPTCPEMVLIPAGSFTMGVPEAESTREKRDDRNAQPPLPVTITRPFYMGKFAVTRAEYEVFIKATSPRPLGGQCPDWRNPGFTQSDRDPVVCVSFDDADAYAVWLSKET